jgi:general secretion pathway protein M
MSLRAKIDKLDARERRLLTILGGMVGAILLLAAPVGVWSVLSSKHRDNQEIRDLIQQIHASSAQVGERRAKHDALLARYAKPAPQLASLIDTAAKANGIAAAESQDRPEVPHGKRYSERITVVKMHKVGMLALAKTLEKIEQSGHPVIISKLNIKPRSGEPDSYEVELGVSAFDRKADAPKAAAAADASAAAGTSTAQAGRSP